MADKRCRKANGFDYLATFLEELSEARLSNSNHFGFLRFAVKRVDLREFFLIRPENSA